jgi:hypothetical protein
MPTPAAASSCGRFDTEAATPTSRPALTSPTPQIHGLSQVQPVDERLAGRGSGLAVELMDCRFGQRLRHHDETPVRVRLTGVELGTRRYDSASYSLYQRIYLHPQPHDAHLSSWIFTISHHDQHHTGESTARVWIRPSRTRGSWQIRAGPEAHNQMRLNSWAWLAQERYFLTRFCHSRIRSTSAFISSGSGGT